MCCIVVNISYFCVVNNRKLLSGAVAITTIKNTIMDIQNTQSQMRKGVLEFCILSIIKQGEVYPSDIVERMKAANLQILEGTLYPLLTRLKNAGYLTYRWVESASGPPRKYFVMTEQGLSFYAELERTWKELADAVHTLTQPTITTTDNQSNLL